jgi:hypothetical protein
MKKFIANSIDVIANGLQYALALEDINEIGNTVSMILAIICSLIIIVPKLIKWFKKAIADGKITKEEIEEGISIIKNESEENSRKE